MKKAKPVRRPACRRRKYGVPKELWRRMLARLGREKPPIEARPS
jgi:hypothetical protein